MDPKQATKIKVTLTVEVPLDKLTETEREQLPKAIEEMKGELVKGAPEGTSAGLGIEYL